MLEAKPRRRSGLGRSIAKFFLFLIVKAIRPFVLLWRKSPVVLMILAVAVVGGVFYASQSDVVGPYLGRSRAAPLSPPDKQLAVETFVVAAREGRPDDMWSVLDDSKKRGLSQEGKSLVSLKTSFERLKQNGVRIEADFVSMSPLDKDANVYFYVGRLRAPSGETLPLPMYLVVGANGRIVEESGLVDPLIQITRANTP